MAREQNRIKSNGFTLVELMISICIIGIAVAVAIPEYEISRMKAKMTSSLSDMSHHRTHIAKHYSIYGSMPKTSVDYQAEDFLKYTSEYTEKLESHNGVLTATVAFDRYKEDSDVTPDYKLSLQPAFWESEYENPRVMLWNCGYDAPPAGTVSLGINHTNVPSNHLPSSCQN